MKYLSECDLLVYDLHAGNPRDVDLAIQGKYHDIINLALKKHSFEEEKVLILISSLMVWNKTPNKLKEIKEGKEAEEQDPENPDGTGEENKDPEEPA